jgi:hypothetical protein
MAVSLLLIASCWIFSARCGKITGICNSGWLQTKIYK